jgi:hypothetical protein
MYSFLEGHWKLKNSMEISDLLSMMSLLSDGSPADPAITEDWKEAVDYALAGGQAGSLTFNPPPR